MVIGLSKSQRKAHRFGERLRFAELDNERERSEKAQQQADLNAKVNIIYYCYKFTTNKIYFIE